MKGLYVDDSNKVLMCTHAKVGSTTWKTILSNNSVKMHIMNAQVEVHVKLGSFGVKKLRNKKYTMHDILHQLAHYYKFIMVRHPFDTYGFSLIMLN